MFYLDVRTPRWNMGMFKGANNIRLMTCAIVSLKSRESTCAGVLSGRSARLCGLENFETDGFDARNPAGGTKRMKLSRANKKMMKCMNLNALRSADEIIKVKPTADESKSKLEWMPPPAMPQSRLSAQ